MNFKINDQNRNRVALANVLNFLVSTV